MLSSLKYLMMFWSTLAVKLYLLVLQTSLHITHFRLHLTVSPAFPSHCSYWKTVWKFDYLNQLGTFSNILSVHSQAIHTHLLLGQCYSLA